METLQLLLDKAINGIENSYEIYWLNAQIRLAEVLRVRAMATNPMDCEDMDYDIDVADFPSEAFQLF